VDIAKLEFGAEGKRRRAAALQTERLVESRVSLSLNTWKQKIVVFASGLGAPGLFIISFLDSSVLSFPIINDLLLVELSMKQHARMPLYALMAATGSVLGCVLLYYLARMGGEAYFHRKAGARAHAIRHWVERNGFGGMLIAALLPPPTPFKIFVFAAGAFEAPIVGFASAITLARLFRYFGVGYLAVRYGENAMPYVKEHWLMVTLLAVAVVLVSYGLSKVILKHQTPQEAPK
jgi:membrane protein YqaA with SNARE-associated domain